jgi:hypothetical protein
MPNSPDTNQHASFVAEQKNEPPQIEIRERITRADLRADKEKIFLFGDNLAERGLGGQAREMRGEENAIGIPTKKAPDNNQAGFFTTRNLLKINGRLIKPSAEFRRTKLSSFPKPESAPDSRN